MTITMGIFRSQTITANSSPPKSADDSREPKMGVLRSQTVAHHISSHFHKSSSSRDLKEQHDDEPELGIVRSCTDPLDKKASKSSGKSSGTQTTPSSENNSGTSTPVRKLERVRSIYERPSSVIPKYYVVAEQVHRFKMRKCEGMRCSDEEGVLIKKMQKWDWKHATHPGEAPPPVGPKNESWNLEGVALEQTHSHTRSRHGRVKEDEE